MRAPVFFLALAGFVVAGAAPAQVPDPTRPAGTSVSGGEAGAALESGVQTVILRRRGKSAAVINGQYVEVGGRLGDKRVLKISESEVVLQGETGREIIKVTPDIEKMPAGKKASIRQRMTGSTEK